MDSLWGEEFSVKEENLVKKIINKIKEPKEVKVKTTEQLLKSKQVAIKDKLKIIAEEVNKTLGSFKAETLVIKDYDTFKRYIDNCINNGVIAIDTETGDENGYGSLNTVDCNIMGLCLYTPGQKNAYIPVNHVDVDTKEKFNWQVTEEQIGHELKRLDGVFKIFHNATFDIEVIKTTCGVRLHADWDTMVAAQLLNENELKGLKTQYILHCNPEQAKYDIEHLFKGLPYNIVDPELFALYAATDPKITYELYEYQKKELKKPGMSDVYNLFQKIEIPVIEAIVDMELNGVCLDLDYAKKMSIEYHKRSDAVQELINAELLNLKPLIDSWKLSPEANAKPLNKAGTGYSKSKNEQLADPIDLGSPTQMAILLYDILKAPVVDKSKPRTTDAAALETLAKDKHIKICQLLLDKREVDILINTFIDKLPEFVQKDGKVHARFNQCGTQTGRFSSSEPNLQQIPSHDKTIRMLFKPSTEEHQVDMEENYYKVKYTDQVKVDNNSWVCIKDLKVGDKILNSENTYDTINKIIKNDNYYYLYC